MSRQSLVAIVLLLYYSLVVLVGWLWLLRSYIDYSSILQYHQASCVELNLTEVTNIVNSAVSSQLCRAFHGCIEYRKPKVSFQCCVEQNIVVSTSLFVS